MSVDVTLPDGWESRVRRALASVRDDFARGSLRPLGAGMESVALRLDPPDGDADRPFVLRFPRNEDGAEGIACEAALLPELAEHLPLPIPRFVFTAPNPLGPGEFCCYPAVPGESLSEEEWHRRGLLDEPAPIRRIAALIDAIHAFPATRARQLGVPEWDPRAEFSESLDLLRAEIVPALSPAESRTLLAAFETYLGDDACFDYEPTLIHADISLDHLLVTGTDVTGLIDFGDTTIGDPDYDLCYLWSETGPGFIRRLQELRGVPFSDRLERKLRFWELADVTEDVLHGIEHGLAEFRDQSLALLRDLLSERTPSRRPQTAP
ncbi:phosphotransferase [Microtetraspora niveoalba]|uniref:phosphotransferase n=1 Tax=Microtetraspora niveoalba TaxID=46175 RepID=UPI00082D2860|nr:phosphotransferase [Microtetraspora niveoalba]